MTGNGPDEVGAVEQLQDWADSNREQAAAIRYLSAVKAKDAHSSLSTAQADTLDATADGWETVISIIDQQAPSS